jgi:glycosyltransferase involved in cell wall biosynthesis
MASNNLKVCFIGIGSCFLISNKKIANIIGPDIQQILLGNELLKNNFNISFICYHKSINTFDIQYKDNIQLLYVKSENSKSKILNYLKTFFNSIKAIRMANSDIYMHHGGLDGFLPLLMGKKCILSIASDAFLDQSLIVTNSKEFKKSRFNLDSIANWFNIKFSRLIIVQNCYQREFLQKHYNKEAHLIKIPFKISESKIYEKKKPYTILWVGSMAKVKQPELFLNLAKEIPYANFQMIGGHYDNWDLFNTTKKEADKLDNLEFLGVVPFDEIDKYFREASILVNTSMFEGFPNSFIQAWINNIPVISLVDPDGIIGDHGMGLHSKNFEKLREDVRILLDDDELRIQMGQNGRQYVEKEHDITNIIHEYIKLFESI